MMYASASPSRISLGSFAVATDVSRAGVEMESGDTGVNVTE